MMMKMKRLLVALSLCAVVGLGGCSRSKQWDKAEIEAKTKNSLNEQLIKNGDKNRISEVNLVKKSENEYTGFIRGDDGSQRNLTVNVDPNTGEFVTHLE